jgi:hypothetical protein
MPQLQGTKTKSSNNKQKVDNILKMESHARKSEVLPSSKILPCATICRTKHLRNLVLGTFWLPLELQTHSITSTKNLFAELTTKYINI